MNLPDVIADLLKAQNDFDSTAYARCFANNALVYDEGRTHQGFEQIKAWNEQTNAEYATILEPIDYATTPKGGILTTLGSGTFPGSPIVFKYHFELDNDKILSLKITG